MEIAIIAADTKKELMAQLEVFDFAVGRPVTVHTSLKAVGETEDRGEGVLECLISFFTRKNGLLCIPTHTWNTGHLDLTKTETCIGVLPTLAAAHPDGTRTVHPSHSMAVFGKKELVDEFVKGEEKMVTPASPEGCYGKIYKMDGYVMLLGVGHNKNTYLHCVEEMLDVKNRLTKEPSARRVVYRDGSLHTVFTHGHHAEGIGDVSANYVNYEPAFRYHGCITDGKFGNADVQMCSARKMKEVAELIHNRKGDVDVLFDKTPIDKKLYEI